MQDKTSECIRHLSNQFPSQSETCAVYMSLFQVNSVQTDKNECGLFWVQTSSS